MRAPRLSLVVLGTAVLLAAAVLAQDTPNASPSAVAPPGKDGPCSLVVHLSLDCSGSMNPDERAQERKAIVKALEQYKKEHTGVKIFYTLSRFGTRAEIVPKFAGGKVEPYDATKLDEDLKVALTKNMDMTCHGCAAKILRQSIDEAKKNAALTGFKHMAIMITDGVTTQTDASAPLEGPTGYAAKLREDIFGIIFVGEATNSQSVNRLISQTSSYKEGTTTKHLGVTSNKFDAILTALNSMVGLACSKITFTGQPETKIEEKTWCNPLDLALVIDVSRSIVTRDTVNDYAKMVATYAANLHVPGSRLAILAFAGEIFKVTDGFVTPQAALDAMSKVQLGVTSDDLGVPGVPPSLHPDIRAAFEKKLKLPTDTARKVAYISGVTTTDSTAFAPVQDKWYPLAENTLIGKAIRAANALFPPAPPAKGSNAIVVVTDGMSYSNSDKCKAAAGNLLTMHNKEKLQPGTKDPKPQYAGDYGDEEVHSVLMGYGIPDASDQTHPFRVKEREASTCCDENPDCNIESALSAKRTGVAVQIVMVGSIWYSDTTAARITASMASLPTEQKGKSVFNALRMGDLPSVAVSSMADGAGLVQCGKEYVEYKLTPDGWLPSNKK